MSSAVTLWSRPKSSHFCDNLVAILGRADRVRHPNGVNRWERMGPLQRPGGNATGINFFVAELGAKRLGLLRELLPAATRVALLINPTEALARKLLIALWRFVIDGVVA